MSPIVETLERMCNKDDPHDKKLLLLAQLVETTFNESSKGQQALSKNVEEVNAKLDKVQEALAHLDECPVYKNRKHYEDATWVIKHPKAVVFILLGGVALLLGLFGDRIISLISLL